MSKKYFGGRVALVTGASRGIGRAVAINLAQEGATVILLARNTEALAEVDDKIQSMTGERAILIPLDVTHYNEIDGMGEALFSRFKKLDIFVANAGILGSLGPITHAKPDVWDEVLAVNLTANFRLIRALDPLLRLSDSARVIFVSSSVGHEARAYWGPYAISKAGIEMLARIYAAEVASTNIKVNILNPGATRTDMRAKAMPGEDTNTVTAPEEIAKEFIRLLRPECELHGNLVNAQNRSKKP